MEHDVIVVGGGPAGSTTAALLARRGHSVVILDRAHFPRTKACGESLNPGAVCELERLGLLDAVRRLPHGEVRRWKIHPRRGSGFSGGFPAGRTGLAIDREEFDGLLLGWAVEEGATIRTGVQVTELVQRGLATVGIRDREGREHRSRFIVGADGLRSIVMRRLGLRLRAPSLVKVGLTAHVGGAAGGADEGQLHLLPWGCAGMVRVSDLVTNVVLIVNEGRRGRAPDENREHWFDRLAAEVPALAHARRVGPVQVTGPFDHPVRDVVASGALLVGDAAGYFDPFTGQGIYRALKGAGLAATAVDRCLGSPGDAAEALRAYSRAHRSAFRRGEVFQHLIEAATSRPRLFSAVAGVLGALPPLADLVIGSVGDLPSVAPRRPRPAPA